MADSKHTPFACSGRRLLGAIIACALALAASGWVAASAYADGDPASDVLAAGPLFLPQDAAIPAPQLAQLDALVRSASTAGYPIRIALIASPTDLGSITELWRQPVEYAKFLGQELSLTYHGPLLVVMPNGLGLYDQGRPIGAEHAAIAGIPIHPLGAGLAATTIAAVQRLSAAAGHPLALTRVEAPSAVGSTDPIPWIVFAAGLAVVGIAWAASLRARPLGAGHGEVPKPQANQPRSA